MFAIVVGGGKTGSYLASSLVEDGHTVAVIEKSPEVFAKLRREVNTEMFQIDGCDPEKLEEAGIGKADLVVAVTGDDEDNLVVSQLAKYTFNVPRVIARVNNPKNRWLFDRQWGVDVAVSAVHIIAKIIQEEASLGDIVTLMKLKEGNVALVEVKLGAQAKAVGKAVKDLALPEDAVLVAILRDERIIPPRGDTTIEASDELLALTSVKHEQALKAELQ